MHIYILTFILLRRQNYINLLQLLILFKASYSCLEEQKKVMFELRYLKSGIYPLGIKCRTWQIISLFMKIIVWQKRKAKHSNCQHVADN